MGRARSPQRAPQQPQTAAQAELAVALAGATGASQAAFVAAVAPLLLPLMPASLLALPENASDVAEETAKLLYGSEAVPVPASGFARTAALEAISYRAAYAAAAVRRLSGGVLAAETGSGGEALRAALGAERRHLGAHLEATRRRLAGARATKAMVDLHGPVLSWRHGETRRPEEPRPTHLAADGANFDLRAGTPAYTGALPGVPPGCSCAWGPPAPGARLLSAFAGGGGSGGGLGGRTGGSGGGDGGPLRNHEKAVIPGGKLTYGITHPTHGRVLRSIGFARGDEADLERQIREGLKTEPAIRGEADEYGQRWRVDVPVTGPDGRTAPIRTGWIFGPGSDVPRNATIFGSRRLWRRWEREGRV